METKCLRLAHAETSKTKYRWHQPRNRCCSQNHIDIHCSTPLCIVPTVNRFIAFRRLVMLQKSASGQHRSPQSVWFRRRSSCPFGLPGCCQRAVHWFSSSDRWWAGFIRWVASSDVCCSSGLQLSVVHLTVVHHCAHRLPVHVMPNYSSDVLRTRAAEPEPKPVPAYFARSRSQTRRNILIGARVGTGAVKSGSGSEKGVNCSKNTNKKHRDKHPSDVFSK